jgi:hypothetical protein
LKTVGLQRIRARTKKPYDAFLKFALDEKVPVSWLAATFARRFYSTHEHYDYNLKKMFDMIVKGVDPFENRSLPVDKIIYLKSNLKAGRHKIKNMKRIFKPYCRIPCNDIIYKREQEICPEVKPTIDEGVKFDMEEVIPLHVQGILENLVDPPITAIKPHIYATIDFGFDGSGELNKCNRVKVFLKL